MKIREITACMCSMTAFALCAGCGGKAPDQPGDTPAQVSPEVVTTKTGVAMVMVPAGEFLMGDERGEDDEKPAHKVQVGGFLMDTCEVTQRSFSAITGRNPSKVRNQDNPVEQVSWYDAITYCNMRSMREGFQPCYDLQTLACNFDSDGYRLPTEAEWEYACRAGSAAAYSFGNNKAGLAQFAWFEGNSGGAPHPVGQKKPNAFGLYDMHGSIYEWCNDIYGKEYYAASESVNPRGPAEGTNRVLRGGSWSADESSCRAAARNKMTPKFPDVCFGTEAYGFRCVRKAPSTP